MSFAEIDKFLVVVFLRILKWRFTARRRRMVKISPFPLIFTLVEFGTFLFFTKNNQLKSKLNPAKDGIRTALYTRTRLYEHHRGFLKLSSGFSMAKPCFFRSPWTSFPYSPPPARSRRTPHRYKISKLWWDHRSPPPSSLPRLQTRVLLCFLQKGLSWESWLLYLGFLVISHCVLFRLTLLRLDFKNYILFSM